MDELLRLLEYIERDFGASEARAQIGGRDPSDARTLSAAFGPAWRVVVTFAAPIENREQLAQQLDSLLRPFADRDELVSPSVADRAALRKQAELDDALDALAERGGARAALVFDDRSPVLWGCSFDRAPDWDLDAMQRLRSFVHDVSVSGIDPIAWLVGNAAEEIAAHPLDETLLERWSHRARRLRAFAPDWSETEWRDAAQVATAVLTARRECKGGRAPERVATSADDWGVFAKGFAQIYLIALVFDGPYSELHAEGAVVRALSHIEVLVLALPPVEPPPRGAKVISLRG